MPPKTTFFVIIEGFQSRSDKSPVSILSQDLWRLKDISQPMFQVFFIYVTIQVLTAKSEQLFSGQRVFKRWSIYFISKFINNSICFDTLPLGTFIVLNMKNANKSTSSSSFPTLMCEQKFFLLKPRQLKKNKPWFLLLHQHLIHLALFELYIWY